MNDQATALFSQALNITPPWYIEQISFSKEDRRMDIYVAFSKDGVFTCPGCKAETSRIHDIRERTWRHLNFFQYKCYIHCQLPRIFCKSCEEIKDVDVPWARKGSGFTLLMEGLILLLTTSMTYLETGTLIGETDKRVFRVVDYYVNKAHAALDCSSVTSIGIDETASRKGHNYLTVVADLESGSVIYATGGRSNFAIDDFRKFLESHGGNPANIANVSCDMSPAFIKGIEANFPDADIVFDKFHIMMMVNKAVNEVRIKERKEQPTLKHTKYVILKNPENLTEKEQKKLSSLANQNLKTMRAYNMKLQFQELWHFNSIDLAETFLQKWYNWITHSQLEPMKELAKTIKRHWKGILNYFHARITNGILESINSRIQEIKRNAHGFRNMRNFITAIYHRLGGLELDISFDVF